MLRGRGGGREEGGRGDEFLQRPAPFEPSTLSELLVLAVLESIVVVGFIGRDILQVSKADTCKGIVAEHGVDGLRELGTARLVDAACINPNPLAPVPLCELAAPPNLITDNISGILSASLAVLSDFLYVLE